MDTMFGISVDEVHNTCFGLIDELAEDEQFVDFLKAPCGARFETWAYGDFPAKHGVECAQGETKGVIIKDELPYVIKLPFLFYQTYTTNGTKGELRPEFDYCRAEARNFAVALKEGYSRPFAACYKVCDYIYDETVLPIYVMEKMNCDEDEVYGECSEYVRSNMLTCDDLSKSKSEIEEIIEDTIHDCDPQLDWIADQYDLPALPAFCSQNYINDVHNANIGFDYLGRPKIIDYSGFGAISRVSVNDKEWWDVD